jgi:ubiquinone/menaquinone biosynthesis C-methylase UbiE
MDRYVIRGGREGAARLQVLARNWAPTTSALFDRVGIAAGARCLDVGCGAGDVMIELARRAGRNGRVTGVDMDPVKLEVARERAHAAADGASAIDFVVGDAYDLPATEPYDVVYCRFLLQHLTRPVDALRGMWTAVGAGGALVVEDADFGAQFCYPPHPAFTFWMERYPELLRRAGGDPESGRKLASLFMRIGLPRPEVGVVQLAHLRGEQKTLPILTIDATAAAMVQAEVATDAEVHTALTQLEELAADSVTLFGSPRVFQAWARR